MDWIKHMLGNFRCGYNLSSWMKIRLLYFLLIFSGLNFETHKAVITKWIIMNGCSLKVDGSTNVNSFSCAITNYSRPDTILVSRTGTNPLPLHGIIRLDVENFDCHNPLMTADLRKTLKAKQYPRLAIRFISINKYPDAGRHDVTRGSVIIELAGVSKKFEVDYKILPTDRAHVNLEGSRKIHFSDFNISPPRKLGGMIRTNNELSVVFNLRMKVVEWVIFFGSGINLCKHYTCYHRLKYPIYEPAYNHYECYVEGAERNPHYR